MDSRRAYERFGEHLPVPELIDWLRGKPQDAWATVVPYLNWDCAGEVLLWVVQQDDCDLVVATWIFWLTDIGSVVSLGRYADWRDTDEGKKIATTIIANVKRGFYRSRGLRMVAPYDGEIGRYTERWKAIPGALKAAHRDLDLPAALLGPFKGRAPLPFPQWRPQHNPYLWDMLMCLGSQVARRPGWNNLFNIHLLSDWRLVLGASAVLAALMIAVDQLMRL